MQLSPTVAQLNQSADCMAALLSCIAGCTFGAHVTAQLCQHRPWVHRDAVEALVCIQAIDLQCTTCSRSAAGKFEAA